MEKSCFHCSLPLPKRGIVAGKIDGQEHQFCCHGCKAVCTAIHEAGLEGFYDRTPEDSVLAPPPELSEEAAFFDLEEVQAEFVQEVGEGVRQIHLLVEGIHCSACVWLIEKTLAAIGGVESAQVNLSGKRLLLRWKPTQIKLSAIIQRLSLIGYAAVPFDPGIADGALKKQNRSLLYRLVFAGFAMMNLMWISIALYTGAAEGEFRTMFYWIGFCLATPTLLYSGFPFLKGAWQGVVNRHLTMDLPIAIGATVTYLYSTYVTATGSTIGEVYYDTVVNFIFVILVGRFLEAAAKRQAVSSTQRLIDLQPRVALVLRDGEEQAVPIRALKTGEIVRVKPGQKIPVDGVVQSGMSEVDESMLSGESVPVAKQTGSQLFAGTVNGSGTLELQVEKTLGQTALGKILDLVETAQASKAPIQCTADRIVPWFVTVTLVLGTLTFLLWLSTDFELALMSATSVLIITCPCAFGLATPMAIAVASGVVARNGVLIKNGSVLETLSGIRHFVFDKTGTLTEGKLKVRQVYLSNLSKAENATVSESEFFRFAYALESYSEHPIAKAIVQEAKKRFPELGVMSVENFHYTPGAGVSGMVDENALLLGTAAWMEQHQIALSADVSQFVADAEQNAESAVFLAVDQQLAGVVMLADQIRPGAKELLEKLRADGAQISLLTGDRQQVAGAVVKNLGGEINLIAEVLPEEKANRVAQLQARGEPVAMVGDGVNDAPALARADIGIALGSGTDISVENADIVLLSNELEKIGMAAQLSRRTLRTVRQNIGISITYNVIMVPLAMMAYITPLIAAISMPISSLLVIGNAARIRRMFRQRRGR